MFDAGLVFNIEFTDDELVELRCTPSRSWVKFDTKIMDGISMLPAMLELPPLPPTVTAGSAHATLWSFVKCHSHALRKQPGRRSYHLIPPQDIVPTMHIPEELAKELGVPNPISCPNDTPIPKKLIVIGEPFDIIQKDEPGLSPNEPPASQVSSKGPSLILTGQLPSTTAQ
jgi:hypothetical protein